jgi:ribokinase
VKKGRVVVVGSSNTDMVVRVPRIPAAGETVIGGDFVTAAGGKGANQAVAAARLGAPVTFIACVGDDLLGRQAVAGFDEAGIDTRYIRRYPEAASGVALIAVDERGDNAIAVALGANERLTPDDIESAAPVFSEAAVVLLQLETPLETVAAATALGKQAGATVILNPAPARPLTAAIMQNVDILTPNLAEAAGLVEDRGGLNSIAEMAERLRARGPERVVVTLGADGALVAGPDGDRRYDALRVEAIDTTAAGDALNGALACALAEGRSFAEAMPFAMATAALSVTRVGAQPSLPSRAEVERFLGEPVAD